MRASDAMKAVGNSTCRRSRARRTATVSRIFNVIAVRHRQSCDPYLPDPNGEKRALTRARGATWLHTDFEPHLTAFYRACGFRPTDAGLVRLMPTQLLVT